MGVVAPSGAIKMVAVLPPICSGVGRTAVVAGAFAPFAADADRAVNSFVSVEAEGVRAAGDGSLHFANATSPVPVTVTARPGWKVNGRRSLSFVHRPGATDVLLVASVMGEDDTHVIGRDCTFASATPETNHVSKPIVQVIPAADRLLAMYALLETNVLISASATWKTVSNGVHRIIHRWDPCPECKAVHDPAAVTNHFAVAPILQKWTSSAEGVVTNAPTWTGWMTKGLDQPISFKVWCTNECGQCRCNASTNTLVDVHELSIGNDLYLGLDRTDAGRTNYTMRTATALIDPEPKEKEFTSYQWTDCGNICTFAGPTDEQIVTYQAYNAGEASERYLDQDLEVSATVRETPNLMASATCKTNFTVVAVNVEINGVKEEKEETEGAFIPYVADATNDVISVEGTNKLVEVKFTCEPKNLPNNEMVKVSCSTPGELYERLANGDLIKITSTNYPACEIGSRQFYLHGHKVSKSLRNGKLEITHPTSHAKDEARYSVVQVDLDVDSDNDLTIEGEDQCSEDVIEDEKGKPGKALYLNELDSDKDGIPDWADGYDSNLDFGSQSATSSSGAFAQMRLRVFSPFEESVIKFSCDDVDSEASVTRSGAGTVASPYVYVGAGKKIRVWTKDGVAARLKAGFPDGDLIKMDTPYKVSDLLKEGKQTLYVEAVGGSAAIGDVRLTATLYPVGVDKGSIDDAVRMTVFSIEAVHPEAEDFKSGSAGKVMISTKQDVAGPDRYYTHKVTTVSGQVAQTEEASVVASAYVVPVPSSPIPNLKISFELTDPDDLSHYEGKTVAGTPGVQGDTNPNDNNDPAKRMMWNNGAPSGYDSFQGCLSSRMKTPVLVSIAGKHRYAADSRLSITDRYSGDNYCVRATLADPKNKPFDTLSGMTAGVPVSQSTVKCSETLIAWKRVYIEQDEMYKAGCTVTADFTPVDGMVTNTLVVDATADFNVGDAAVAFWPGGSSENVTVVGKGSSTLSVAGLNVPVPKYGGFRIVGRDDVYTVDRRFLPNAYGSIPDGSDGGAFIELRSIDAGRNPNARVPKYDTFPNAIEEESYAKYWFDRLDSNRSNVAYVLAAKREVGGSLGVTFLSARTCTVYVESNFVNDNGVCLEETVAHELGHRFGLRNSVGGKFRYIDHYQVNVSSHDDLDKCLMSYDKLGG